MRQININVENGYADGRALIVKDDGILLLKLALKLRKVIRQNPLNIS